MSHTIHAYPLADEGLHLIHAAAWAVSEPDPDDETPTLLDLADAIIERLAKAEALTRLLQSADVADAALPDAAWAIADLIAEAHAMYTRQWELIRSQCLGQED